MLGAANEAGFQQATLLLGLAGDKDAAAIAQVVPMNRVHRVGYAGERSRTASQWPSDYDDTPWHAQSTDALAATTGPLIISGSFYLVGEVLTLHASTQPTPQPSPQSSQSQPTQPMTS